MVREVWHSLAGRLDPRRFRIGTDPLYRLADNGARYGIVPIDRFKVFPSFRHSVLSMRKLPGAFSVDRSQRLAVVVPYRDRTDQLRVLLERTADFLDDQHIDYRLVVVEQEAGALFNRGKVLNIGAHLMKGWADYYCFHDVDNLPEFAEYGCPSQPMRLVKRFSRTERAQKLVEGYFFGAVVSIQRQQFYAVNGFDNEYWGWGNEDEDFFLRCLLHGLVPHEDKEGVFWEFDNPKSESEQRGRRAKKVNRARMKKLMRTRLIGFHGIRDLEFELREQVQDGRIMHAIVGV